MNGRLNRNTSCVARRVLVIGADGMDPGLAERLMAHGQLPVLRSLRERGAWGPLATTFPPVSPVAWTSFLSGRDPASHGILDFVTKKPGSYRPTLGLFDVSADEHGLPLYRSRRRGPTIGQILSRAGKTAFILKVPGTFPPEPVDGGLLAGLGMPDVQGTFGTSAVYATDPTHPRWSQVKERTRLKPLPTDGELKIEGPGRRSVSLWARVAGDGLTLFADREGGQPLAVLSPGGWSPWLTVTFPVASRSDVPGICRFKLVALTPDTIELYRTPVECSPYDPLYPLSQPPALAADLAGAVGLYPTIGLPADQTGLTQGLITAETFLEDAYAAWEQQAEMTRWLMQNRAWDVLISHFFTVDSIQHTFWSPDDGEVARAYGWMDTKIGELLELAGPDTVVMVASDHGGTPIHRWAYLNAWLAERGYLRVREGTQGRDELAVDWAASRACAFGTGAIFFNVAGREPRGTVQPGREYEALRRRLASELSDWVDEETGRPVVKAVLNGEDVYGQRARGQGPDLLVALHKGYGLGRGEALGRVVPGPATRANTSRWSGGHEGPYLPDDIPGVLLMCGPGIRRGTRLRGARITDVAPTILRLLRVPVPGDVDGRALEECFGAG